MITMWAQVIMSRKHNNPHILAKTDGARELMLVRAVPFAVVTVETAVTDR